LKISADAKVLSSDGSALLVTAKDCSNRQDVEIVSLPDKSGQVNLLALVKLLAEKECNNVLVEAGAELAGAFLQAGLVDEFVIYMAPKLLGSSARPLLSLPFDCMDQQVGLDITDIRKVGDDIRITAAPADVNRS